MSLDDLVDVDPNYLVEALETMADEQPTVARSIPKHAKITKKKDESMKNCLFEQDVSRFLAVLFWSLPFTVSNEFRNET